MNNPHIEPTLRFASTGNERQRSITIISTHLALRPMATGIMETAMSDTPNNPITVQAMMAPQPVSPDIRILTQDEPGPGGAYHEYLVSILGPPIERGNPDGSTTTSRESVQKTLIKFQKGGIMEAGVNGLTNESLLEIVRHRLACFQAGPFACKENASALAHVEDAIMWLNRRTSKRRNRGVEGKAVK